ncbi:hypothetical protein CIB95_09935 [Lottiidibacillus patelloidae]|uniref:Nucleoside triphosphate/diphosphate phosphatase n=1 Tax=Lottiidibacillus patelloidae TaxID=2670334 RepID=A0A263BTM5_9BACI|nr:DUF402 domain-containing protein [Lottiidibacillus patelloidae]OZM57074.1 hypothetical protein CIB95_09935 [Lottiidibacillus patelloidae]
MNLPEIGQRIQIQSYKHNGLLHRTWEETVTLKSTQSMIIGGNDRTTVTESDGRTWRTREPAICFFHTDYWFNTIAMLRNDGVYYYCNLSSPFTWDKEAVKYIDYDLDIKVFPDMTYVLLDEDEYELHSKQMRYPEAIDRILKRNVDQLISFINMRKGPFAPDFVDRWYEQYLRYY